MPKRKHLPIALTIAGSDSGGGAGIQADLKTFAALGVHGTSVITCVTAQNPKRVLGVQPCSPKMIEQQLEAIFAELPPAALKTGMLYSAPIIRMVSRFLDKAKAPAMVVDPVMVATSGAKLLKPDALKLMISELIPRATIITPNLAETELLLGGKVRSLDEMRTAARDLHEKHGCAVVVKGGHLPQSNQATDVFYDGCEEVLLKAPFIRNVHTHGTGCSFSAAITACLANGIAMPEALVLAKKFISGAVANGYLAAGHFCLHHLRQSGVVIGKKRLSVSASRGV